jgi:hypothetical protein
MGVKMEVQGQKWLLNRVLPAPTPPPSSRKGTCHTLVYCKRRQAKVSTGGWVGRKEPWTRLPLKNCKQGSEDTFAGAGFGTSRMTHKIKCPRSGSLSPSVRGLPDSILALFRAFVWGSNSRASWATFCGTQPLSLDYLTEPSGSPLLTPEADTAVARGVPRPPCNTTAAAAAATAAQVGAPTGSLAPVTRVNGARRGATVGHRWTRAEDAVGMRTHWGRTRRARRARTRAGWAREAWTGRAGSSGGIWGTSSAGTWERGAAGTGTGTGSRGTGQAGRGSWRSTPRGRRGLLVGSLLIPRPQSKAQREVHLAAGGCFGGRVEGRAGWSRRVHCGGGGGGGGGRRRSRIKPKTLWASLILQGAQTFPPGHSLLDAPVITFINPPFCWQSFTCPRSGPELPVSSHSDSSFCLEYLSCLRLVLPFWSLPSFPLFKPKVLLAVLVPDTCLSLSNPNGQN